MVKTIEKRDGSIQDFNAQKVENAIKRAYKGLGLKPNKEVCKKISEIVFTNEKEQLSVNEVQIIIENALMHYNTEETDNVARAYITYRSSRDDARRLEKTFNELIEIKDTDIRNDNANVNACTPSGQNSRFAALSSVNYAEKFNISKRFVEAKKRGEIYYHDADWYNTRSQTCLSGETYITLKDNDGKIINTQLKYFDDLFIQTNNIDPENIKIDDLYILGRGGWTPLKSVTRRYTSDKDTIYKLIPRKGINLIATGTHKIPVIREDKEILLEVEDIKISDKLLTNPKIVEDYHNEYINIAEELLKCNDIDNSLIILSNIDKLKKWLFYKYDINNVDFCNNVLESKTYRNGNNYITLEQYKDIVNKYDIPYEVLITLEVKMKGTKNAIPLLLPITENLAKFFGYLYSDGSVYLNDKTGSYQITFTNTNQEINKIFEESSKSIFVKHIIPRYVEGKEYGRLIADKLITYLVYYVLGKKENAAKIDIPDFIMHSKDNIKWSFISAAMDGDGCINRATEDRKLSYYTVCENYANKFSLLLSSLNVESKIQKYDTKNSVAVFNDKNVVRNYDGYSIVVNGKDNIQKVLDNLNCYKRNNNYHKDRVVTKTIYEGTIIKDKIKLNTNMYVYDLETEEHWFIANNFVVHNCLHHDTKKLFKGGFWNEHGTIREPQRLKSAIDLSSISIQANQNLQHGGQSIACWDNSLVDYAKKSFKNFFMETLIDSIEVAENRDLDKEEIEDRFHNLTLECGDIELSNKKLEQGYYQVYHIARKKLIKESDQAAESFVFNMNNMHSRGKHTAASFV